MQRVSFLGIYNFKVNIFFVTFIIFINIFLILVRLLITGGKLKQVVEAATEKGHVVVPLYQNRDDQRNIILKNRKQDLDGDMKFVKLNPQDKIYVDKKVSLTEEEQKQYDETSELQEILYGWMMAPTVLSKAIFPKLRKVYSADACHAKTGLGGTFFFLCAEDSNDSILLLAAASFYDNESSTTWGKFLSFVRDVYPEIDNESAVFFADGDKGFQDAFKMNFFRARRFFCMRHMLHQHKHVSHRDKKLYNEAAATANTDKIFRLYSEISAKQRDIWSNKQINISEMFPGLTPDKTWGKNTSSTVESLNHAYVPIRSLHSVDALIASINRETKVFASNKIDALYCKDTIPPRSGREHVKQMIEKSNRMVNLTRTRSRENQLLWTIVTELKDNTLSEQVCSINDLFCSCKSPEMTRKPCRRARIPAGLVVVVVVIVAATKNSAWGVMMKA